jgi:hypothetical protein
VSTGNGGAILLTSSDSIVQNLGNVSSDTGAITLAPTINVSTAIPTSISTNGNITVNPAPFALGTTQTYAGTLSAGGNITLGGSTGNAFTLITSGTIVAGGNLAISNAGTTSNYTIGGSVTTGGNVTLTAGSGGAFSLLLNAPMTVGILMTINAISASSATMSLLSSISTGSNFTILDNNTGPTSTTMSGVTTAGGAISIGNFGASGTLSYTLLGTGSLTGTIVGVAGQGGGNTLTFFGNVTGTSGGAGAIAVNTSAGMASSNVSIYGVFSTPGGGSTVIISSTNVGDTFVVTPSTTSPFTFSSTSATTQSLSINTALSNAGTWSASFASPITFTAASGLQSWTKTSGTWSVTPNNAP